MLARSLVVFIGVGVLSGLGFGLYLLDARSGAQIIHVDGPSLSVVTEKSDFKLGESVRILVVNSGTTSLEFADAAYGLRVTGLSGILMYAPESTGAAGTLAPGEEASLTWDQTKHDGGAVLEGLYKISASGMDPAGAVEGSTTITIWK